MIDNGGKTTVTANRSESSRAYDEGVLDRQRNGDDAECPYPSQGGDSAARIAWWDGYLDERNRHLFELTVPEDQGERTAS